MTTHRLEGVNLLFSFDGSLHNAILLYGFDTRQGLDLLQVLRRCRYSKTIKSTDAPPSMRSTPVHP